MNTKYGEITDAQFNKYIDSITGRVYAILPMKEEGVSTIESYIESLSRELVEAIDLFTGCERILSVICILRSLIEETDHKVYRKEILHCCNIISGLGDKNV